ncbi:MAG: addiction module protein [Thermoanaerobaculia bacterium]|nr:addiction module protein [Thermoanaerobaculia bacterium]
MTFSEIRQAALNLPVEERRQLVEALWESLESEAVVLPAWQEELLDRRLERLRKHPERGSPWEEVEKRVFADDE